MPGRDRIGRGEFHPGQFGPRFRRHQVAIAGVGARPQQMRQKAGASGRQHGGAGHHPIRRMILLPANTPRASDRPIGSFQQFEDRALIEDGDSEIDDLMAQRPQILRAAEPAKLHNAVIVFGKIVIPRERRQHVPGQCQHPRHPIGIAQAKPGLGPRANG